MTNLLQIPWSELSLIALVGLFFGALLLLCLGGDGMTRGGAGLALRLRVNPVVVGLTVVAMATSMPELSTCLVSLYHGSSSLVLGNIIGSNICNIGLILGVAAMINPVRAHMRLIYRELPLLLAASALFVVLCLSRMIERQDGFVLLLGCILFFIFVVRQARREDHEIVEEYAVEFEHSIRSIGGCFVMIVLSGVALSLGADLMVKSALALALRFNLSEGFIGFAILALGTSLPELAASVMAMLNKQSDICVGNIIGSNILNILLIGGTVAVVSPLKVGLTVLQFELPVMMGFTVLFWLFFFRGKGVIQRRVGSSLVLLYLVTILQSFFF